MVVTLGLSGGGGDSDDGENDRMGPQADFGINPEVENATTMVALLSPRMRGQLDATAIPKVYENGTTALQVTDAPYEN